MPTADESRAALELVTDKAVDTSLTVASRSGGSPTQQRAALLETVPEVIGYYTDGSAALAADFYDDTRAAAGARGAFTADLIINDRVVKIRRGIAWASEPLFEDLGVTVEQRLAEVVQLEVARPYRDTILGNRQRDPAAVGWRRILHDGCPFCRMLADRGAVYKESTARFAAHPNCNCGAQPVFEGDPAPEASVMQYVASRRSKTPKQRAELREYLASVYGA